MRAATLPWVADVVSAVFRHGVIANAASAGRGVAQRFWHASAHRDTIQDMA
jgi:hypothetical protein